MTRILLLFVLCTSLSAQGAQWIKLSSPGGGDAYYYDKSKLFISGDEITYWKKIAFLTPQETQKGLAASGLYRERIHCTEHTLRMISYLLYDRNGSVIDYVPDHEALATPIIPDTIGDIFERSLCALVARHKTEESRKREEEEKRKLEAQKQNCPEPDKPAPTPATPAENATPEQPAPSPQPSAKPEY